jgi:hypothetical protein
MGSRSSRSRSTRRRIRTFSPSRFAFVDGVVVEFMQYANPGEEGWF